MENLNYKMGWLVVFFDLPVGTPEERRRYTHFRKALLEDGYVMLQLSVYARACVTYDRVLTHSRRVKSMLPLEGNVRCLYVTNIQWEKMFIYYGRNEPRPEAEKLPEQLLLW